MPTTASGLRYPALTDSPNGPLQIQNVATDAEPMVVPAFASITARNTALPSPTQGKCCTVAGRLHTWTGSKWTFRAEGTGGAQTDASGFLDLPHGLGVTPSAYGATPGQQSSEQLNQIVTVRSWSADATNIRFRIYRSDTNVALASNAVVLVWWAVV